jgi:ABC-type sulfate transport system substrate-binding protein
MSFDHRLQRQEESHKATLTAGQQGVEVEATGARSDQHRAVSGGTAAGVVALKINMRVQAQVKNATWKKNVEVVELTGGGSPTSTATGPSVLRSDYVSCPLIRGERRAQV